MIESFHFFFNERKGWYGKDTPFFLVIGKGDRTKILVKGGEDWYIYIYIYIYMHDLHEIGTAVG